MTQENEKKLHTDSLKRRPRTITGVLVPQFPPDVEAVAEEFRIEFEKEHGPTDLTLNYVSLWPYERQKWLAENHPDRFFDALPLFIKAWHLAEMKQASREGKLDFAHPDYLKIYMSGDMERSVRGKSERER